MSIETIVISEETRAIELLRLYIEESENFSFLAGTCDFVKAYNAIKELSKALVIVDISEYQEQALNFVSKITSELKNCKVIILSEKPDVDIIVRAMRVGANDFLPIPLIKNLNAVLLLYIQTKVESEKLLLQLI